MLKVTKTVNLNGESKIGDNVVVMLSASISSISNSTINKVIVRRDLYKDNKDLVKTDMDAFELEVMTMVDEFEAETVVAASSPTPSL